MHAGVATEGDLVMYFNIDVLWEDTRYIGPPMLSNAKSVHSLALDLQKLAIDKLNINNVIPLSHTQATPSHFPTPTPTPIIPLPTHHGLYRNGHRLRLPTPQQQHIHQARDQRNPHLHRRSRRALHRRLDHPRDERA